MRSALRWALALLALSGCVKSTGAESGVGADDGGSQLQAAQSYLEALSGRWAQRGSARDEALWAHWTTGTPLNELRPDAGDLLNALSRAREAQSLGLDAGLLLHALEGEALALVTADAEADVANVHATATFTFEGKEVPLRELTRLLMNEPSALKRKALWLASADAALREGAAHQRLAAARRGWVADAGLGTEADWLAYGAGLTRSAAVELAAGVLDETAPELAPALTLLAGVELNLAVSSLTRADLPRLLKTPATHDARFSKAEEAKRAFDTLGRMGLYGAPSLTFDYAEAAKKHPLPLTIRGAKDRGARSSARPVGGLRDQEQLLGEVGASLALMSTSRQAELHLQGRRWLSTVPALWRSLVRDPDWLLAMGVVEPAQVAAHARAVQLLLRRRAAAVVAFAFDSDERPDEEKVARWGALLSRATGITCAPADGERWPTETASAARALDLLLSERAATQLRAELDAVGTPWWSSAAAGQRLLRSVVAPPSR